MKTNPVIVRKTLGSLFWLFGIFVCVGGVYSAVRYFIHSDHQDLMDYVIVVPIMLIMVVVSVIFLQAGTRLYRAVDEVVLKNCVGLVAFAVGASVSARLASFFPNRFSLQVQTPLFSFIGALVGIVLYLIVLRKLMELLGQGKPRFIWLLNNTMFGLLAWFGVMLLTGMVFTKEEAGTRWFSDPYFGLIIGFSPFFIPLLGYKLATIWLKRARGRSMEQGKADAVRSNSIN